MDDLIQWPRAKYWDKCWNPWIGCKPCSPACENCYAAAQARRFGMSFEPHETNQKPPRSGVVFCGNMTDLFGEWIGSHEASLIVTHTLGYSHKAKYLWLTKRPINMIKALYNGTIIYKDEDGEHVSPFEDCEFGNQYFGMTAENQEWFNRRCEDFRRFKPIWMNGWLSLEPILDRINMGLGYFCDKEDIPFRWVVVGCESGPNRRPCKIEWVEDIVDQCRRNAVPVFVKQLDIDGKCVTDIEQFPKHLQIRQVPWEVAK